MTLADLDLEAGDIATAGVAEVNWTLPPERGECKFIDAGNVDGSWRVAKSIENEAKVL